jgi:hypothetical protein
MVKFASLVKYLLDLLFYSVVAFSVIIVKNATNR